MNLSKSRYCMAVQCPKMLWLRKYREEEFDDSCINQAVLDTGKEVGELARNLFGAYEVVPYTKSYDEMIHSTTALLEEGVSTICEASFSYQGLFCRVDILRNLGDKTVEIYEVKSSTDMNDIYLDDVTFQRYVLTRLGYSVKKACLVHINNQYVRRGELDLSELFVVKDITKETEEACEKIGGFLEWLDTYMSSKDEPKDDIGEQCFNPYECGFFAYCTRKLPKPNIFDLKKVTKDKKLQYYRDGMITFDKLLNEAKLTKAQCLQIEHELAMQPPHIEVEPIRDFMNRLSYPLYFLDFESFSPAIPMYDNSRPYEQIVFQYSLHIMENENGKLQHREFLAYPGKDPRRELAERLCADIPMNVCTVAYNMTFEKTRIKELVNLFPDLADHLMNIAENMKDLMIPFQKNQYYVRAMHGSYSIKYVLPALFPDNPELDYHSLEGVHNGSEASATFKRMGKMSRDELEKYREYLLKYCGLDTFAMVKIWERLWDIKNQVG